MKRKIKITCSNCNRTDYYKVRPNYCAFYGKRINDSRRKIVKQMKNTIKGIIFWTIALAFMLLIFAIGNALANVITINFIIRIAYITLGFSFIYILKS